MYDFYKHLSSYFPSQIIVDVTQICNLACIHCPHSVFVKSEAYKALHLSMSMNKKLIEEVASDGQGYCQYVRYTANGEPLIHPKIEEIIAYACSYSRTKINLTTNGVLLSEKKTDSFLESGIDAIDISIDAHSEDTYLKIRKKGNLDIVKRNVSYLIEKIQKENLKTKVLVSFVEQDLNKGEAEEFSSYWRDKGVDFVLVRKLHSAGGAKPDIKKTIEDVTSKEKRRPCLYPWERLVLTPSGEVGFCPADWKHLSTIADFRKYRIREIWQGEFMESLREAHLKNRLEEFDFCKNCPDWVYTKWPESGKSYSDIMREVVDE